MLQVTNRNDFDLKDRYNGIDYTFPANTTVALDEEAAKHIFGFGDSDKVPYLVRQGWVRSSGEVETGMKMLSGFSFSSIDSPLPGEVIQKEEYVLPVVVETASQEASDTAPDDLPASTGKKSSILSKLAGNA